MIEKLLASLLAPSLLAGLVLVACDLDSTRPGAMQPDVGSESLGSNSKVPTIRVLAPAASYDTRRWESTLLMATTWQELGFDVDVRGFPDFATLLATVSSDPARWEAYVTGYLGRPQRLDPDELLYRPFHCSGIMELGANLVGYCNPEYDAVVEAQRVTLDQKARQKLVYQAQEILARDIPIFVLFYRRPVIAYNQSAFDNWRPVVGRGLWNIWNMLSVTPTTEERTLKAGWATDISTTNPLALDAAVEPLQWTYDTLARIGPSGTPIPWAAKSWSVVDRTTVDVTLREGMRFHDGEPVRAQDVKFSFDFIKQHGIAGHFPAALSPVKEVQILGDDTVRFELFEPFAPLFFTTFTLVYILPEHIWTEVTNGKEVESPAKLRNATPVGSGPFKLIYHRRGEELLLKANKDHFRPPHIDGLLIVAHAHMDAVFSSLMSGKVHLADRGIAPLNVPEARAAPHLGLVDTPDHGIAAMGFNLRRPPFNDLQLRRAVAHTLDHDTVVEAVLGGFGEPGRGVIAPANEFWHNPASESWFEEGFRFDKQKARLILEEAGYRWDAEGKIHYPAAGSSRPD